MNYRILALVCLIFSQLQALEYTLLLENDSVIVSRLKIMAHEEIGLHRDAYQQVVIAIQGGIITRLEADGSTTDVHFPTGQAVFREIDPPGELHRALNNSSEPIEILITQLKK